MSTAQLHVQTHIEVHIVDTIPLEYIIVELVDTVGRFPFAVARFEDSIYQVEWLGD